MEVKREIAMVIVGSLFANLAARAEEPGGGAPEEEYQERYIGFDDLAAFDPRTGVFYKATEPYQGKYKKPLAAPEFYRMIGREDLAQEYAARESRRNTLIATGTVVGLGSLLATVIIAANAMSGGSCDVSSANFGQCVSDKDSRAQTGLITAAAVGIGGGLVGGALMLAGASTNPNPLDASQMRELADGYNRHLKQQLGVSVLPLVAPDTAGLALDVRF